MNDEISQRRLKKWEKLNNFLTNKTRINVDNSLEKMNQQKQQQITKPGKIFQQINTQHRFENA